MGDLNQLSPGAWRAALIAARRQQATHLRLVAKRFFARQGSAIDRGRWFALVLATLCSAALLARHGGRIEIVMVAIAAAALISSVAGFAFSAICGAMLFHLMADPVQVVQLMIICSIANQATMTWSIWRNIDWGDLGVYLAGGAIGLIAGIWVLLHANSSLYSHVLGVFLLVYGTYMLICPPVVIRGQHAAIDFLAGFLGGVTGGAAGFPSASVLIWCSMKGWDKTRQRGIIQPFILIMQVAALVAISLVRRSGTANSGFDLGDLLFIPASLLGTSLGLALYRRLSDSQFARAVNILLIASGMSYVV